LLKGKLPGRREGDTEGSDRKTSSEPLVQKVHDLERLCCYFYSWRNRIGLQNLMVKDFEISSCQATLFTPEEEVSSAKVVKSLLPQWMERFDADPVILPSEGGMPREIPKLMLRSKSGSWRCDISSARINLFWQQSDIDGPVPTIENFYKEAARLLNEYSGLLECRVGRLAAVLKRYAKHQSPGVFLAERFCKKPWLKGPLAQLESFELHVHKRYSLAVKFSVNSWIRSKTGTISYKSKHDSIILVEQDLNTMLENATEASFSQQESDEFFSAVIAEFDETLELYYS